MSKPYSFHIQLVHPPVASPAAPPWEPARAAALFACPGLSVEQYDANLDFLLNHVLSPTRLTGLVDLIGKREKQGLFSGADADTASLLADLAVNHEQWIRKIAGVGSRLELLRTEDFYRPESCLAALKDIGDLLALASLAYYPFCIRWGRFSNPRVWDWPQAAEFIEDQDMNPFLSLCQNGLASRIARPRLGLLILFVPAPAQMLASLTMARFIKKQRPGLHVALLGDHGLLADARDYGDSLLPETDQEPLLDLVTTLRGSFTPGDATVPDFSGLPLKDYLTPAVVLPFGAPTGSGHDLVASSRLMAVLEEQERRLGAQGFISKDDRLTPAYMAELAPGATAKQPAFCLALECALDTATGREEMAAAHKVGVRLIEWRDPHGQIESLTSALWDARRAGIWNHVVLPGELERNLAQGLVRFMAANPNIAHSWIQWQAPASPFASPAEQTGKASAAYTQVAELPGRSLWQVLNEPVYLLLYLNRHGVKKVMRWRVRDDGCSVYALGQNISFHFVKPQELAPGYLDEICRMVEAGGSVGTKWVRYNLERAFLIGYVLEQGVIVGNSSLKHPRPEYVEAINKHSGLDVSNYLERGYTSVRPEYRGMGIGTKLLEGLTARVGKKKVFSIIGEDNVATQKIALRNQTKKVTTFFSERLEKEMGVWMPAWMIED
jgi:GNAT superfamily N-acetyltransferase